MNKRTQKKRSSVTRTKATPKKRPKRHRVDGFKKQLNLFVIWALVVVNGVLIFSLVNKIIHMPSIRATIQQEQGDDLPVDPVTMTILNGCGVQGLAKQFKEILVQQKYDVRSVGNADDVYTETVLLDSKRRPDEDIEQLRKLLGLDRDRVIQLRTQDYSTDVKLILGQDYSSLKVFKSR